MVRAVSAGVVIALFAVVVTQVPRTSCVALARLGAVNEVAQPCSDATATTNRSGMLRCMVDFSPSWKSSWYSIGINNDMFVKCTGQWVGQGLFAP
jgi:hypothetical protein